MGEGSGHTVNWETEDVWMNVRKLYYDSAYQKEFEGTVVSCTEGKRGFEVVLDETAFYPEGGGQPFDTGLLGAVHVLEVHEKNGQIIHTTDGPLPVGERVHGAIDWERRFLNMQLHSGEHLVSGLIHQTFGYDNVGFHMGMEEVTIDFNGLLEWDDLMEIETRANTMIWENREIEAGFYTKDELRDLDYRSKKELTGEIRIVRIPDGDTCACCGTHVSCTGEIGLVKFTGMIHYKGGVRISLLCGKRAVADYERMRGQLHRISNLLSIRLGEAAEAVEKMKHEMAAMQGKLAECVRQMIEMKIRVLPESDKELYVIEKDFSAPQLRQFANRLLEEGKAKTALVLSENGEENFVYVLASRGGDMRACSKELNLLLNGRGGGSQEMAQGTFFKNKKALCAILKEKGFTDANAGC